MVVLDAVQGVEAQSETVWRQADKYHVPRICFVNKMDRVGANFHRTIEMIIDRLKAIPIPIQLPLGKEETFEGVIDLVESKAWRFNINPDVKPEEIPIPESEKENAVKFRQAMIERLGESDDKMMELIFGRERNQYRRKLKLPCAVSTVTNKAVPVICGSSLKNKGIQLLLDAVVDYLPSPLDMPALYRYRSQDR